MAQSSGPENIALERPLPGLLAAGAVLSPSRITLENNGKIRPQPDRENAFARASGGVSEPRGISAQKASKNRLRSEYSNGGLIYTEGDSRSFADMIFAFFTNLVSENHPSRFWPSERISRTAASNSSIACSAAVSFIATIRS